MIWAAFLLAPARANGPPLPVALSALQSFRGTLSYSAHEAGTPGRTIAGTLVLRSGHWTLDERGNGTAVHLSDYQSWLVSDGRRLYLNDPLAVLGLCNAWALLVARSAGDLMSADASGRSWTVGETMRVYPEPAGGRITGLADQHSAVSFSFDDWSQQAGLWVPGSATRMSDGIPDTTCVVDAYKIEWAQPERKPVAQGWQPAAAGSISAAPAVLVTRPDVTRALRFLDLLFLMLAAGLAAAVWLRRDALAGTLCTRLASDPRAWRDEGTTAFVSPEGILWFGGRRYRIGAAFFNRRVKVQTSLLFVRVSAPDAGMPVVLARKFPRDEPHKSLRRSSGLTLVETLVATALFATVIVAAVFPTLIVLAHADRVASLHEAAVLTAQNALVDEEAALEYGSSAISDTSTTSQVDGLDLTLTVAPTSVSGMQLVTASVTDPGGAPLATLATMVGPPVPAPAYETGMPPLP